MKRIIESLMAGLALVILSPILAVVALVVRVDLGRPVIFRQARAGKRGRSFNLYKFRSMRDARDAEGNLLPDDQRMTRVGQLLRSTSIDELPQLFNVVRGDMSFVGPRPLIPAYTDLYTPRQASRLDVNPGLTAWASVNGRNTTTWDERFELDAWYVENRSLWLDLRILALTAKVVLTRQGVSAAGHATMPRFQGSTQDGDTNPTPTHPPMND